jgi:hypothetical protein
VVKTNARKPDTVSALTGFSCKKLEWPCLLYTHCLRLAFAVLGAICRRRGQVCGSHVDTWQVLPTAP